MKRGTECSILTSCLLALQVGWKIGDWVNPLGVVLVLPIFSPPPLNSKFNLQICHMIFIFSSSGGQFSKGNG